MFMIHQAAEMAASHLTQEEIEALPSAGTPTRDTGFRGDAGWRKSKKHDDLMGFNRDLTGFNGIWWDLIGYTVYLVCCWGNFF